MRNKNMMNVQIYLMNFNKILNTMASKMLNPNITNNNITINFINCMIPHHQAAIYMCENLLNYTRNEHLYKEAKSIIATQTRGIEQMKEISMTASGYWNSKEDVKCYMEKYFEITNNMIYKMRNSERTRNININFISEMIPHHEGAIKMCENLLKYNIDPRLKRVAESIIKEQSEGIEELRKIRSSLYRM